MLCLSIALLGLFYPNVYSYTCSDFVVMTLIFLWPLISRYISSLCCVTQEGACELSEDNILSHDRFTDTADECQVMVHVSRVTRCNVGSLVQAKCRTSAGCSWFTHLDTQCYLLRECGHQEQ